MRRRRGREAQERGRGVGCGLWSAQGWGASKTPLSFEQPTGACSGGRFGGPTHQPPLFLFFWLSLALQDYANSSKKHTLPFRSDQRPFLAPFWRRSFLWHAARCAQAVLRVRGCALPGDKSSLVGVFELPLTRCCVHTRCELPLFDRVFSGCGRRRCKTRPPHDSTKTHYSDMVSLAPCGGGLLPL